ncbi:MAG TPA: TonB-dependent receptor [Sphingobacteriaceae bacterium]
MRFLLCICIFFASVFEVFPQKNISGRVIDAHSFQPIQGASIRILKMQVGSVSDSAGRFYIDTRAVGNKGADSIAVSFTGYKRQTYAITSAEIVALLEPLTAALREVVVTTNREARSRKEVPIAVGKIDATTIQDTRATALHQLLNKVAGVHMVDLGNEQHTMAIRQPVTYNAVYLYMEDGLPIRPTGIFNHNALYEINMQSVKDIEVIKGPASSIYGSNAIGGAVNFSSPYTLSGKKQIALQGDGYNYYRLDGSGNQVIGKWGVYAGGYIARQENSWQEYTDFNKYSGTLKATYDMSSSTRLTFTGTYNYLNTETPGNLDSARFYNRSYGSNQHFSYRKVRSFRASSRIDHTWNSGNASFLTLFYRNNSTGQLPHYYIQDIRDGAGRYVRSAGQENNQSFESLGFLLQHKTSFNFLNSQLLGGVYLDNSPSSFYADYLQIDKDPNKNFYTGYTNIDSLIDDYRLRLFNTAAYIQYEINPVKALRVVTGLRYDNVRYDFENLLPVSRTRYKQQEQNRYHVVAPKLGLTYDLGVGKGIYANFSMGFQPPETSFLYSSRQTEELKQATFSNYEIGGWLPLLDKRVNLELSVYRMDGRNEVISVLMADNSTQNQNAGATLHLGVEYNLNYSPSSEWAFRFGGTNARHSYVQHSEIRSGKTIDYHGNLMAGAPSWIANSEVTWKPTFVSGLRSSLEWQHVGKYFVNTANSKSYNGYDLLNLRLGYDLQTLAKGAGIWLNVLNLTDKLYSSNVIGNQYGVTYAAAAPRTFSLGFKYSFSK